MLNVPLVDLGRQHRELGGEIEKALVEVCSRGDFILGRAVREFEAAFAAYLGARHCLGVGNGTDALTLIMRALNVGPGDEVIVPANTFIATALAVSSCGATPVLVDCDERWATIDARQAAAAITDRTKALIPVHLYGQPADLDPLLKAAAEKKLWVIEDAAQAHGARYKDRMCGNLGVAAGFSFYPGKNLGGCGDGGAVVTNDDGLAEEIGMLRNCGSREKYHHPRLGCNSRLDSLQAAVLAVKLPRLEEWNEKRNLLARRYAAALTVLSGRVETIGVAPTTTRHAYHLFVVRIKEGRRDEVLRKLQEAGIGAGIHYPFPLHLQGAYRHLGKGVGAFPAAERLAGEILSLPLCPYLGEEGVDLIVDRLQAVLG